MPILDLNKYSSALMGAPPDDFKDKVRRAERLNTLAAEHKLELDEDVYLIAALAHYQMNNSNPGAFVQRAKQIGKWLFRSDPPATPGPLELLQNRATELARLVFQGLFQDEGFILLVFDEGSTPDNPGHVTYVASCSRDASLQMLRKFVKNMQAEQAKKD